MSRNDDEKKAKEMQKALRLPGREVHIDPEKAADERAFLAAMENGKREDYEALLRKRGFKGVTLRQMLEAFDEYQEQKLRNP